MAEASTLRRPLRAQAWVVPVRELLLPAMFAALLDTDFSCGGSLMTLGYKTRLTR